VVGIVEHGDQLEHECLAHALLPQHIDKFRQLYTEFHGIYKFGELAALFESNSCVQSIHISKTSVSTLTCSAVINDRQRRNVTTKQLIRKSRLMY